MRLVDAVCLIVAIGGAAYVYNVKHEAEVAHDERRTLERQIGAISQDVGLLEADLAALEQPARLQGLISSLPDAFPLEPISTPHYIDLADIPFRSEIAALDVDEDPLEGELDDVAPAPIVEAQQAPSPIDVLLQGLVETAPAASTVITEVQSVADGIGALLQDVMPEERP